MKNPLKSKKISLIIYMKIYFTEMIFMKNTPSIVMGKTETKILDGKCIAAEELVSNYFKTGKKTLKIFNNVYIWNDDLSVIAQIDHVVITDRLIYIVETKDLYGWTHIYNKDDKYWHITQSGLNGYSKTGHLLYSPYLQNKKHIEAIKKVAPPGLSTLFSNMFFINMCALDTEGILYWGPNETTYDENGVFIWAKIKGLPQIIKKSYHKFKNKNKPFTEEQLNELYAFFSKGVAPPELVKLKHLEKAKFARGELLDANKK